MSESNKKKFKTLSDVSTMSCDISQKIKNSGDTFDIIIGITRGGWVPTVFLSNCLDNTPIVAWEVILRDGKKEIGRASCRERV